MTILNNENDGLYPELIVLFRTVIFEKNITRDDLIKLCSPENKDKRIKGTFAKWHKLGLFEEKNDCITINAEFLSAQKNKTIKDVTSSLPRIALEVLMKKENSIPLWSEQVDANAETGEKGAGETADLVRGLSWLLAQDVFSFPVFFKDINKIEGEQLLNRKKIFSSDFRYNALRHWMRFLGFATGEGSDFQIDPTIAIRDYLPSIFSSNSEIYAKEFINSLCDKLPVIDCGIYRTQIEQNLDPRVWRKPNENHLSTSLSLALKRLQTANIIVLNGRADTGSSLLLTGQENRTWGGFESVIFRGNSL